MSDTPNHDLPEGPAQPEPETTRPESWAPSTDAGLAAEPAGRPVKGGAGKRKGEPPAPQPVAEAESTGDEPVATPPGERIAKAMARAGVASRRDAEAMVLAGRVSVNGETLTSPARNVTEDDRILIDGAPLPLRERSRLWIFHKPRGVVTTAKDPEGRQTVFEILPDELPRVVAVGRLDINTEGLLLLTNDGGLAKVIAHPDTGWLRRYRVRAHGDTDQAQLDKLAKGVTIDGMEYGPVEATLDRVQGDNVWLTLGLREGKNREVKRILEHLGLSVNRLIRLSFGPFQLGDLEVGLVEEVRTRVLKDQLGKSLAEQAGVDFESPVREPITPFGSGKKVERDARTAQAPASRRNAARPAPTPRVSTGGSGSGPRNAAWRDEEAVKPRGTRIPRRGVDPRAAQAAAAERGRERVGSIRAGDRRVVVERLSATPVEAPPPVKARRRYAEDSASERPARRTGARPERETVSGGERGARERPQSEAARAGAGPRAQSRRDEDRGPRPGGRRERSFEGGPSDGASRGKGGFRAPRAEAGRDDPAFDRGKPRGAKPGFSKPGASKPGGSRPGGSRPGGFAGKGSGNGFGKGAGGGAGGRPGGRPGSAPRGGARPGGGSKPGGGRPPRGAR
ncbi:pseudouridine synthase [Methylobacterium mesophilicum SR1.6/6]|uniref:Pseudouridine synthase n=1 Tax=Methylobacterium mesophilicum SR1.6/6 TaxID=908290 RepID=A0A6B9FLH3_9HYPH|nr:pseudouridine synthase [Methylobacterium mesophilicum]QGY01768.1 pseudouridine synthase [Methylobacterium mesophilicum SR1.6/6]